MPETQLLPLFLVTLAATAAGFGLHKFGGREGRSWAVPVSAAVLLGGADWFYDLPSWAVLGGMLLSTLLFHRTVRSRLGRAARAVSRLPLPQGRGALRRIPDYSGKHVAAWTTAPEGPKAPPEPLVLVLDFIGEAEDEYEVRLIAKSPRPLPGQLLLYHDEASGDFTSMMREREPISGVPGAGVHWSLRALPLDFAFSVLDMAVVAALHDILALRTESREVYVRMGGDSVIVGSTGSFTAAELARLLPPVVLVAERAVAISRPQQ